MTNQDMVWIFGRIGCLSFGGPAAQIALMQKELVDDRPLLSQADFLKALSFCMMLPGPEAMQLATYAGWKLNGLSGGLIAGGLFILPGTLLIGVLAFTYATFGALPLVQAAFLGIKAAVIIIVVQAIMKLFSRTLQRTDHYIIAVLAFTALFLFNIPFPAVILLAASYGAWACSDHSTVKTILPWQQSIAPTVVGGILWVTPLVLAWITGATFLLTIGLFFSKLALVTFGGAYAVLAYMTQTVVTDYGWLTTSQMVDALGLAETTPGPLILITAFVAMLVGTAEGGWTVSLLAGLMAVWVTFVPCFIWIFAGAPLIDWLDGYPRIRAGLATITAAVVGVIANLSLWFVAHIMFTEVGTTNGPLFIIAPVWSSFNTSAALLTLLAAALLLWRKWGITQTLAVMAVSGLVIVQLT
ncbi:MAG: chromate efflux transporter [Octadecabacter sp.]|nr:chromate efflux transporter [Octadecabacter sp.]